MKQSCNECPFSALGGSECDGEFLHHVGEGCESETATEALERLRNRRPEVIDALAKIARK